MNGPEVRRAHMVIRVAFTLLLACAPALAAEVPGRASGGTTLLPTGWKLSPVGRWAETGDFPLAVSLSPDGHWAVASCSGEREVGLAIVDLDHSRLMQTISLPGTWLGVTFIDGGRPIAASGGTNNRVYSFTFEAGRASLADSLTRTSRPTAVLTGTTGVWPRTRPTTSPSRSRRVRCTTTRAGILSLTPAAGTFGMPARAQA